MAAEAGAPAIGEHLGLPSRVILPFWVAEPYRLWSLLDMFEMQVEKLHEHLSGLQAELIQIRDKPKHQPIPESERARLCEWLSDFFDPEGLLDEEAAKGVLNLISRLAGQDQYVWEFFELDLTDFKSRFEERLRKTRFALIPEERAEYFRHEELFGKSVRDAFPSARDDIREAGSCFATGTYTATVFHLMRAVERAIHVLARDRQVPWPEEYNLRGWEELLNEIQGKVNLINDWPRSPQRAEALSFYRSAINESYYFKDAWRNHVMHSRSTYDRHQALSAMNHVKDFMSRLSTKLSENRETPLDWGQQG